MPRKIFTDAQTSRVHEAWQNGLTNYKGDNKKVVSELAKELNVDEQQIKSKIDGLKRDKKEKAKRQAAADREQPVQLKGCSAYTQFMGESLHGTTSDIAAQTMTEANKKWREQLKGNPACKVYEERAAQAQVEKQEFMTSAQGKAMRIAELINKQAANAEELAQLGVQSIGLIVEEAGLFTNVSSDTGKEFMKEKHPNIGTVFAHYVCGAQTVPLENMSSTEIKRLRNEVQGIINRKFSDALRVADPTANSTSQFPYKSYRERQKTVDGHTITVTGLKDGERLKDVARYGPKMLKWIISNQDNINISLSLTPQEIIPSSATPSTPSTDDVSVENANEANGGMEQDQLPVSVENADEENGGMEQDQVPEHLEELMNEVGMNTGDDAAEEREFPVEAIVGEQLDNGIVKYIVKWQGYEKLTLEGQENLADNICFKRYMKSKGRRSTKGKVSKGQRVKKTKQKPYSKK